MTPDTCQNCGTLCGHGEAQWQPIASAPEGEHVLVHHPKWPIQPVRIGLLLNGCGDFVDDHNNAIAPTHWMPLPAAPKGTP